MEPIGRSRILCAMTDIVPTQSRTDTGPTEMRRSVRVRLQTAGRIVLKDYSDARSILVQDLSVEGACLMIGDWSDLPETFHLLLRRTPAEPFSGRLYGALARRGGCGCRVCPPDCRIPARRADPSAHLRALGRRGQSSGSSLNFQVLWCVPWCAAAPSGLPDAGKAALSDCPQRICEARPAADPGASPFYCRQSEK